MREDNKILTHLNDETQEEVECSQSHKKKFELHVPKVVKFDSFGDKLPRMDHQPRHHGEEEQHQAEENPYIEAKKKKALILMPTKLDSWVASRVTHSCSRGVSCEGNLW